MTRRLFVLTSVSLLTIVSLVSCVSSADVEEDPIPSEPSPVAVVQEEEPELEPVPVEVVTEEIETVEPQPDPPEESEEEDTEFSVSEQVFAETFEDVRRLIDELNSIIRVENYERWLHYLTDEYIEHFSSAEVLKENSEQPLLKKYDIELNSLLDYFMHVVVPSRSNTRLDDLVFIDNEHVKAIMIIKNNRTILYSLEKGEDGWKIGL